MNGPVPRINRRELIAVLVGGFAAMPMLAACASTAAPTAVPNPTQAAAPTTAPNPAQAATPVVAPTQVPTVAAQPAAGSAKTAQMRFAVSYDPTALEFVKKGVTMVTDKYPNLKITIENSAWGDYWQKLTTDAAGGNTPDLINMVTMLAQEWLSKTLMLNLQPYISAEKFDVSDYWPKMMPAYKDKKGDIYALPYDISIQTWFYNADIFDKAGVPHPTADTSWDDLRLMAPKLVTTVGGKIQQFAYDGFPNDWPLEGFLWENGGKLLSDDLQQCTLNSPACVEVVQYFADLRNKDKVSPTTADASGVDLWNSGRIATQYANSSVVVNYRADSKFNWDVLALPKRVKNPDIRSCSAGGSYCAAKTTKTPDEAWVFVREFTSKEVLGYVVGDSGRTVPGRRSAPTTLFNSTNPKNAKILLDLADKADVMQLALTPFYTKTTTAYNTMLTEIYEGRTPAQAGLDQVKKQIDLILQGKD